MNTQIVTVNEANLHTSEAQGHLEEAAKLLKNGKLVVFPTETVYGLGGDATDATAATKIYAAKGRPSDNPLIIHIADPDDAEKYCHTTPFYYRLAKAFMPGPLTIILPKKDIIPHEVTGGLDSVAVRCPSHPVAHALIEKAGIPIAAPSANLSGRPSPTCAAHVASDMTGRVDMIIDGGMCDIGLESTIVKLDGEKATLLRPGAITYDALRCVCSEVVVADAVAHQLKANERPLSPGMKYKHYAPASPFVLLEGDAPDVLRFFKQAQATENCAILCYDEESSELSPKNLLSVGKKEDLATQAHRLFDALRRTDDMHVDIIYGHLPPMEGLGLALYNRMIRAAAHTVKHL